MPYFWNDESACLDEIFDTSEFTEARTVFIRFKQYVKGVDEIWIRNAFQKTDDIESVEISVEIDHIWAYVTYVDSYDAYRAVNDEKHPHVDIVLPADTWVQPIPLIRLESESHYLLNQWDKFYNREKTAFPIYKLISMSLTSTSKIVAELITRYLSQMPYFEIDITDHTGSFFPLSELRSIMRVVGGSISGLQITFQVPSYPQYLQRYFEKICQYVQPQMRTLRIVGVPENQEWYGPLRPLFERVECLSLHSGNFIYVYDIDFALYCQKLERLELFMSVNMSLFCKRIHTLKHLVSMENNNNSDQILEFMVKNTQLQSLKFEANRCDILFKEIPICLPYLNALSLIQGDPPIDGAYLQKLARLRYLRHLQLITMFPVEMESILLCLPHFMDLTILEIRMYYVGPDEPNIDYSQVYKANSQSIVSLAQGIPYLKQFCLQYCQIDGETLASFIAEARTLQVLGLYGCNLEITEEVYLSMETARVENDLYTNALHFCSEQIHPVVHERCTEEGEEFLIVKLIPNDYLWNW